MKLIFLCLILSIISCQTDNKDDRQVIQQLMEEQQYAWNNGDLESFMKPYLKSDSLVFIGGSGIAYGWQTTLNNYKKSYSSKEKMGQLLFENEVVKTLDENSAMVGGRWNLFRKTDTLSGNYLLLWQKTNGLWKIVADHSSSDT